MILVPGRAGMFSSIKSQEFKPYFEGFEDLFLLLTTTNNLLYKMDVKIATSNTDRVYTMCYFPLLTSLIPKSPMR